MKTPAAGTEMSQTPFALCKRLIAFGFAAGIACVSCFGADGECKELRLRPIDAAGKPLETYCVVPLYAREAGMRVGPEAQGGTHDPAWYLLWITEKTKDEDLACLKQKRGSPVVGIPLTSLLFQFGETIYPSAKLFLKRGYLPFAWNKYHDSRSVGEFVMKAGDSEELVQHLLSGRIDQERMRETFMLRPGRKVVDEFTDVEREKLRRCYYGEDGTPA